MNSAPHDGRLSGGAGIWRRTLSFGALLVTLAAVAGCASPPSPSPLDEAGPSPISTPQDEGDPAESVSPSLTPPDACHLLTLQQIADAATVGDVGPAVITSGDEETYGFQSYEDAYGQFVNRTYCDVSFSDAARDRLGIRSLDPGQLDLAIGISTYNGRAFGSGSDAWTDSDPDTLLTTYYAANQRAVGENSIAEWVPDSDNRLVQDGATVVGPADTRFWVEISFFLCTRSTCGDAAVSVARAVISAVAASQG